MTYGKTLMILASAAFAVTGIAPAAAAASVANMSYGSQGWNVSVLQEELVNLGYHPGSVGGQFTHETLNAVKKFQENNGIAVDGIVGPVTERTIASDLTQQYDAVSGALGSQSITYGDYGPSVVTLQGDLSQLGYQPGPADGVFNRQTGQALMAFQQKAGLDVSEIVGPSTYAALKTALGDSTAIHTPAVNSVSSSKPWVLGYYTQYSPDSTSSQDSLASNLKTISAIAPLWYTFQASGHLVKQGYNRSQVRAYADKHGVGIYPLVTNGDSNDKILTDASVRNAVVDQLVALAKQDGYQGYNIDFEGLNYWDEQGLTDFVKNLSEQLTPLGKTVTIAVIPRTPTDPYNRAYNYQALAPYVSKIVLMTYDDHCIGTAAGPVAPISWVKAAVKYAVARVNPSKVVLGLAAYGYNWSSTGNTVEVHDDQAVQLAAQYGVPIQWNANDDEAHFTYTSNGNTHQVYFENGYSDAFKLQLVQQYHLGGVAIWRLGDEDEHLWTVLNTMGFSH